MPALVLAAIAAAAEPNLFGENGEYQWECIAELTRDDTALRGWSVVTEDGIWPGQIQWQSRLPIPITGGAQGARIVQSGIFSIKDGDWMFAKGNLLFNYSAGRSVPVTLLMTFGSPGNAGGFVAVLDRDSSQKASTSILVNQLMRWFGDQERQSFSLDRTGPNLLSREHFGTGWLDRSTYQTLERDLGEVRGQLAKKADDFQRQCTRIDTNPKADI